jgi:hypothetical protein
MGRPYPCTHGSMYGETVDRGSKDGNWLYIEYCVGRDLNLRLIGCDTILN